jgi:hypothetical protein
MGVLSSLDNAEIHFRQMQTSSSWLVEGNLLKFHEVLPKQGLHLRKTSH